MTIPEIISKLQSLPEEDLLSYWKRQLTTHAEKRFAQYYEKLNDGTEIYKTLTYEQFDRITTNLACEWKEMFKDTQYIGYINFHSIDYMITYIAILKMGLTLVCLSTKNSSAANASVLKSGNVTTLLTVPSYNKMAYDTADILSNCKVIIANHHDIDAMIEQPLNTNAEDILQVIPKSLDDTILVLHSSGSTGSPKIIYLNSRVFMNSIEIFQVSEKDSGFDVFGNKPNTFFYYTALFHMSGQILINMIILNGGSIVFMEPKVICTKKIFAAIRDSKCDVTIFSPLTMEQLLHYTSESGEWSVLQNQKAMIHAGASMKREVSDLFTKNRVNICSYYGSTELGGFMTENLAINGPNKYYLKPLSIISQYYFSSLSISAKRREDGNFETGDLFLEDASNPGHYTYFSRTGDILVLNSASKVNPIPIESIIRQSPVINHALVFGEGHPYIGVLVELSNEARTKYSDNEIQDLVHSAVDEANASALEYTVIKKSMIKILSTDENLPTTDKNTVMRNLGYVQYKKIIDDIYNPSLIY
ncbi:hypothetical protein BDF14DRAFT_1787307 [Spinellus fusiger]|nr:hypothetical protein BDF14DRAFT_1787307 [Spinellus fusiger]